MVPIHDFHLIGVELGSCLNGATSVLGLLSRQPTNGWVYSRMLTAGEELRCGGWVLRKLSTKSEAQVEVLVSWSGENLPNALVGGGQKRSREIHIGWKR